MAGTGKGLMEDRQQEGWRGRLLRWAPDVRGAVYVEFLIAFLPVYVFFLCLIQLALLFTVRLITDHAAQNAARAAAVVIGDEGLHDYDNEPKHQVTEDGARRGVIRNAALLTLAPLIVNGVVQSVEVGFPPEDVPDGEERSGTIEFEPMSGSTVHKVRVRVTVEAMCRIGVANRIVCPTALPFFTTSSATPLWIPTHQVRAEAVFPYQGARYDL
jgi:hypothetical protein